MNESPHNIVPALSLPELNKLIAYEGHVGRVRKEWCEGFISWKTDQLEKLTTRQKQIETSNGNHISCSKGCWFCCSQHVSATLQECDAIVYWLYQHDDIFKAFLIRYPNWRKLVHDHEYVFQQANQAGSAALSQPTDERTRDVFMQKADAYGRLDIICPFLDQGSCSIYPVRPFVCAGHIVVTPPEHCKPSVDKATIPLSGAFHETQPPYFRGPKDNLIYSPVALLVHEIIHGGFVYLNDLNGLNGLEEEALTDPRIHDLLKGTL